MFHTKRGVLCNKINKKTGSFLHINIIDKLLIFCTVCFILQCFTVTCDGAELHQLFCRCAVGSVPAAVGASSALQCMHLGWISHWFCSSP